MSDKVIPKFKMDDLLSPSFKKTIDNGNDAILDPPEDIFSIDVESYLSQFPIVQPKRQAMKQTDANIINSNYSRITSGLKQTYQDTYRQNFASQKPLKGFGYTHRNYNY